MKILILLHVLSIIVFFIIVVGLVIKLMKTQKENKDLKMMLKQEKERDYLG